MATRNRIKIQTFQVVCVHILPNSAIRFFFQVLNFICEERLRDHGLQVTEQVQEV